MTQTPEDRIRRQYKAARKRIDPRLESVGPLWLQIARQWKRPVQEIKRIVKGRP